MSDPFRSIRREMEDMFRTFDRRLPSLRVGAGVPAINVADAVGWPGSACNGYRTCIEHEWACAREGAARSAISRGRSGFWSYFAPHRSQGLVIPKNQCEINDYPVYEI
jgi:hypothetical protein